MATIGAWVGVLLTIFTYSHIVYKDNKLFRLTEGTFIGVGIAYGLVVQLTTLKDRLFIPMIQGQYYYIILVILGLLVTARVSVKYGWLSRYGMAIMTGIGTGLAMLGAAESNLWKLVESTYIPLIGGRYTPIDNIVTVGTTVLVLLYFFFTYGEKSDNYQRLTRLARYIMIFGFGGYFGNTVLTRYTWLSARIGYLVRFFLGS
jgi:hypothetical protein